MNVTQWSRDLVMGARFAFTGGREGWTRALLTGVGVGLGVALLLLTTSLPGALAARDERGNVRYDVSSFLTDNDPPKKSDRTFLSARADTAYHTKDVRGRLMEPEGPHAPLPPGVAEYPAPGEMVVSPALKELLASEDGRILRERLPYRIVGTISEPGLIGSHELAYVAGAKNLAERLGENGVGRLDRFGDPNPVQRDPLDPTLTLLVLVIFVALLTPVAVFVATAVRFGGEQRDRRLAALRLVGTDSRMTRRIAAGEALAGSLLGLAFGAVFFMAGRRLGGSIEVFDISVFPSYISPSPVLAVLVAVAVPAAAVAVTVFAMRGVVVEPLGVVRTSKPARRRLWWRLLMPVIGIAMLVPMIGKGNDDGNFNAYLVTGGVVLVLVGITALLPWIVEAAVARMGSGPVSWQLAVRRLQLSSGTAARMVNGIAVAVAGAIALQMMFTALDKEYVNEGQNTELAQMQAQLPRSVPAQEARRAFGATEGVRQSLVLSTVDAGKKPVNDDDGEGLVLTVGDCASLQKMARLPSCSEGDVFRVDVADDPDGAEMAVPGRTVYLDPPWPDEATPENAAVPYKLPAKIERGTPLEDTLREVSGGLFVTPSALPSAAGKVLDSSAYLQIDERVPEVRELVRNSAMRLDPMVDVWNWNSMERTTQYDSIRTGLFVGAACVLALIGASLLVSQLEQLRERRKLLSALIAFGTRRRTLSLSVLWQTAIPIMLGLLLSIVVGLALGTVLLKMSGVPVSVDWGSVLAMAGVGAATVAAVTALSMPPLLRLMRPDGLRTE